MYIPTFSSFYQTYISTLLVLLICVSDVNAQTTEKPQQSEPLHLGLLPHLSTNLLLKKYKKLITYLESHLKRRIVVYTAPNFKTYIQRTTEGRYDLYLTAPHLASFHETENGHQRVAVFSNPLRGVIAVAKESAYTKLSDLQGKMIYTADKLAVITLLGEVTLKNNNIDGSIKHLPSHNSALHAVSLGRADAAIVGGAAFQITTNRNKLKRPLRILTKTDSIPHMMFMASDRVSAKEYDTFKRALLHIEKDAKGRAFINSVPFGVFSPITDQHMQRLSKMVTLLKERLKK